MVWFFETNIWRKSKLRYINRDRFIISIKTEDIYLDNAKDVETRLDISHYELDRPFPEERNKKVIWLLKD